MAQAYVWTSLGFLILDEVSAIAIILLPNSAKIDTLKIRFYQAHKVGFTQIGADMLGLHQAHTHSVVMRIYIRDGKYEPLKFMTKTSEMLS